MLPLSRSPLMGPGATLQILTSWEQVVQDKHEGKCPEVGGEVIEAPFLVELGLGWWEDLWGRVNRGGGYGLWGGCEPSPSGA